MKLYYCLDVRSCHCWSTGTSGLRWRSSLCLTSSSGCCSAAWCARSGEPPRPTSPRFRTPGSTDVPNKATNRHIRGRITRCSVGGRKLGTVQGPPIHRGPPIRKCPIRAGDFSFLWHDNWSVKISNSPVVERRTKGLTAAAGPTVKSPH